MYNIIAVITVVLSPDPTLEEGRGGVWGQAEIIITDEMGIHGVKSKIRINI
jgi:hypothetical protein